MSVVRTDPEVAVRRLSAVLGEEPGLIMARRSLALAHAAAGQHRRAIAELRHLEKEGKLSDADAIVLGDSLRRAGQLEEAVVVLERTARENPRFARAWLALAAARVEERRFADAAAAYEHVLSFSPDHVEALRGRGDLELLEERTEAAGRRYARILEIEPEDAGAMARLGVVKMRTGRQAEGMELLRRAVEREPDNGETLISMAESLASSGRPAEALPYFERAIAAGQRSAPILNRLALTRLAVGDHDGATKAFRESLRLDPGQPDVRRTLAEITRGGGSD